MVQEEMHGGAGRNCLDRSVFMGPLGILEPLLPHLVGRNTSLIAYFVKIN